MLPTNKRDVEIAFARAETACRRWYGWSGEVAYRVDSRRYSVADEYGDHAYTNEVLGITAFPVIKRTDKGFRVQDGFVGSPGRWVSFSWTKRFACLTPREALESFVARKRREAGIYEARAARARRFQKSAEIALEN